MKINLYNKDGKVHIFAFYVISENELQINKKIEECLNYIQDEGYEIVDIKLVLNRISGWCVSVLYK